jgi:CHAT domain-containing protein
MPTSSEDLARLLAQPRSILHIAAHGARVAQQSLLETDTRLELGDVVLTRDAALNGLPAPSLVYLSACRSSDVEAESLGGFSLAHAFLLGGADHVVGATGELDGSVAASFAEAFYRALGDDPAGAPEAWRLAYRETARALSRSLLPELRKLRLYAR